MGKCLSKTLYENYTRSINFYRNKNRIEKSSTKIKITILGHSYVGKSFLLNSYIGNSKYNLVDLFDYKQKLIERNGKKYKIMLYTQSGQEIFDHKADENIKDSNGIIFVYNTTEINSFLKFENRLQPINNRKVILVFNNFPKHDISIKNAIEMAKRIKAKHFEIDEKNATLIFDSLIYEIIDSIEVKDNTHIPVEISGEKC